MVDYKFTQKFWQLITYFPFNHTRISELSLFNAIGPKFCIGLTSLVVYSTQVIHKESHSFYDIRPYL